MKTVRSDIRKKPIRKCYTQHECCVCGHKIVIGDQYYDGGPSSRIHVRCTWTDGNDPKTKP